MFSNLNGPLFLKNGLSIDEVFLSKLLTIAYQ